MKINRYITRGISEQLSLDLQILLWNMVKEQDNQAHTDYLHIFRLQDEDNNILSITHEQEQPAYKLEYHYTNYVKIKMHYLRKSTSFVKMTWKLLLCDAFTRRILKGVTMMNTIKSTINTEAIFSDDEQHRYLLKRRGMKRNPLVQ